jgi:hypothetical protein
VRFIDSDWDLLSASFCISFCDQPGLNFDGRVGPATLVTIWPFHIEDTAPADVAHSDPAPAPLRAMLVEQVVEINEI